MVYYVNNMKIYISGPITGLPNKNIEAFNTAAEKLRTLGFEVLNPFDLDQTGFNPEECWFKYLKRDLKEMLSCDALCLLPGWEESKGARLEIIVAIQLALPLFRLDTDGTMLTVHVASDVELTPIIPSHLWQTV